MSSLLECSRSSRLGKIQQDIARARHVKRQLASIKAFVWTACNQSTRARKRERKETKLVTTGSSNSNNNKGGVARKQTLSSRLPFSPEICLLCVLPSLPTGWLVTQLRAATGEIVVVVVVVIVSSVDWKTRPGRGAAASAALISPGGSSARRSSRRQRPGEGGKVVVLKLWQSSSGWLGKKATSSAKRFKSDFHDLPSSNVVASACANQRRACQGSPDDGDNLELPSLSR